MSHWDPAEYYAPIPERDAGPDEPDFRLDDDGWWPPLDEDIAEQERLRADIERKPFGKLDETNLEQQQEQSREPDQ